MNIRAITRAILFLPLMAGAPLGLAAEPPPHEVVIGTVEAVIDRLQQQKTALDAQPERIYALVNELILPRFDFDFMSRAVLGKRAWRDSSATQHADFTQQFTKLLVRTYAKALLGYTQQRINYLETIGAPNAKIVQVKTEVISPATETATPVDYWLRTSDGDWRVINVAFQGVNLVKTYRKSFASEINNHGIDSLIQKLAEKNASLAETVLD